MRPSVIHAVGLITRALWVRFHVALILFATVLAGVATSALLLRLDIRSMPAGIERPAWWQRGTSASITQHYHA